MVPLIAEKIGQIGSLPITNSLINSFLAVAFFVILALALRGRTKIIPKGLQNLAEMMLEFMLNFMDQVTHSRERSRRFLPLVGTLFLFILFSNWLSQLPGTGSIGLWEEHHGQLVIVPFLRPATSDLNLTLALAVTAVAASHLFGIITIGFFKHLNKFIQLGTLWQSLRRGGMSIFVALIEMLVGVIEIFSEIAKVISLSLRLFGNIFAGEVLLTVIASLAAYLIPLPFIALEILVGAVQATVFSVLALVYLTMMTATDHA